LLLYVIFQSYLVIAVHIDVDEKFPLFVIGLLQFFTGQREQVAECVVCGV